MDFFGINKRDAAALFLGDAAVFSVSLWLTLLIRRGAPPSGALFALHFAPFSILFLVWVVVFYAAGLYEKHTTVLKNRLPHIIFNAQIANSALAILFFYLIPYFGITPKTTLFIYLVVSFALIVLWRRYGFVALGARERQPAVLVGSGAEMRELLREVNGNPRYGLVFISSVDLDAIDRLDFKGEIIDRVYAEGVGTIVIDTRNEKVAPVLPRLYNLIFSKIRFIDMHKVYEDMFDRVPLSLVRDSWFLENISATRKFSYEFAKRAMDIALALPLLALSILLLPFVWLAVRLEDGGALFIAQERIGKNNRTVRIYKVRTMNGSDEGRDALASRLRVTKVGAFLRKTRIDELPQLWNVLRGDVSLIGPRPELPALVERYEREVPYYNIRHLVKPGLSGWGQIRDADAPRKGVDVEKTRVKLSYDLYYIKNRSLVLDLKIALRTVQILLSRTGI